MLETGADRGYQAGPIAAWVSSHLIVVEIFQVLPGALTFHDLLELVSCAASLVLQARRKLCLERLEQFLDIDLHGRITDIVGSRIALNALRLFFVKRVVVDDFSILALT